MATAPPGYNYATAAGIQSLPAAVVFSIFYAILILCFLPLTIRRPAEIFFYLLLFCVLRLVAFVLRALLAHVSSIAQNEHIFLAYEIIYSIGFFSVLLSVYTLLSDRSPSIDQRIARIIKGGRVVFRLTLTAAVTLGITGTIDVFLGTKTSTINTGTSLRKAAIYLFLVCSCVVVVFALLLAYRAATSVEKPDMRYPLAMVAMSLLLVVREAFFAATINNATVQDNEHFWYPFAALTELLVVCWFAIPDFVPKKTDSGKPSV